MANKMSYDELEEACHRQKETIKLLCSLAKDLLTVVERQNIKLDNPSSTILRFKIGMLTRRYVKGLAKDAAR